MDLAKLPPAEGYGLWCHVSSSQWHVHDKGTNKNFAPTWGNKRSPKVALLMALRQLWRWFLEKTPSNVEGVAHLARLDLEIQKL